MKPMEAAIKGAGEIGFTIVSISFSLVAVFIPLLFMGGIVGRLFREFAVTVTAAVLVSAFVCLTLTPMMCSRFLHHDTSRHGWLYRVIEAFFTGLIAGYRRTLDIALRHHFITLLVFFATASLSVYLYIIIPKGFFPPQDNGIVLGITEAAQDISFNGDDGRAAAPGRHRRAGSGHGSLCLLDGRRIRRRAEQPGAAVHQPEADRSARRRLVAELHQPAAAEDCQGAGRHPVPAAGSGCARGCAAGQDRVPIHAAGREPGRAVPDGVPISWPSCGRCRCCATRPATSSRAAPLRR